MREFTRHRLSFCFLVAALAFLVFRALQLALIKNFSIDELTYAHAAWLISTGKQPFRDFFFHHFPFSLQLGSLVFTGFGDSPTAIILLRKLMIPFWAATAATVFMLNRCRGWLAALTGAIFLLSTGVYLDFATEFRPESVATPLFLLALLFTSSDTARWSRLRSLASGAALILAVWSSEKALFYGIIFFFAVFADLLRARRPFLLARPDYFVLGSTLILLTIGAYLTVTANWLPSWRWAFAWAFEHEKHYPGFSPLLYLGSVSRQDGWILGLGIAGWISEARKISMCRLPVDRRSIIIWTYWAAFLSFVVQRAPYPYSLVPFVALNAVYGGRFIALVYQYLTTRFPHHAGIPTAALIVLAFSQWDYVPRRVNQPEKTNLPQLETLRTIGQLTRSDDSLYDNTGGFVARPSAHFFYFTDAAVRNTMKAFLNKEMPAAIRKNRALVYLHDIRFQSLPDELKAFITEHYQPYTSDIWIWGKRFDSTLSDWNFEALESGTYFIYPATIVSEESC